eukprot:c26786_g1_i1 orf=403-1407(-)
MTAWRFWPGGEAIQTGMPTLAIQDLRQCTATSAYTCLYQSLEAPPNKATHYSISFQQFRRHCHSVAVEDRKSPITPSWQFQLKNGRSLVEFVLQGKRKQAEDSVYWMPMRILVQSDGNVGRQCEVRVCTNKACRKNGSLQTLELLRGLAPPDVSVESCACLGRCGLGPNLVVLPAEIFVSHCSTAAHAARLLAIQCGAFDPERNLNALSLKQQGNKAFEKGDHSKAEELYSTAIDLKPSGGLHLLFANRSAAQLARGYADGALRDAEEAARIAPKWPTAHLRQAEAHIFLGDFHAAHSALANALFLDPSLRRSKSFQIKVQEVEAKLVPANIFL